MNTRKIGSLTELYTNGGGYFTEAYPTNFHHFYTQKILVGTETADDFKDVTAAEMETIKAQDAKWVAPSASLKERAKAADVAYNETTGNFSHNGIDGLTTAEVAEMLARINEVFLCGAKSLKRFSARTNIVTAAPLGKGWGSDYINLDGIAMASQTLEVLKIGDAQVGGPGKPQINATCYSCPKLRRVIGELVVKTITSISQDAFRSLPSLEEIDLVGLKCDISFKDSPLLSVGSLRKMVSKAINTAPISITVHPDVFAKLSNTDAAAYIPENLLLESDVTHSDDNYMTASYQFAHGQGPKEGEIVTVTLWGQLGEGKNSFFICNSGGTVGVGNLVKIADGIYRHTFPWKILNSTENETASNTYISVYAYKSSVSATSTINKIKMEYGENTNPVWTPALSEINDAALREKAQWAAVMQMAQARQISFIEAV